MTELARLVQAAQGGDRLAYGELYARYARLVHGIALSRVPRVDTDDLVHDVFVMAMQRLTTLRDPEAFGAWVSTIARNLATDYVRRTPKTSELTESIECSLAAPDRSEALAVLDAIRALPEPYREPLMLRLVEGMTGPEIAERTGLTEGSVRVNLHRGMKLLRERLRASYE